MDLLQVKTGAECMAFMAHERCHQPIAYISEKMEEVSPGVGMDMLKQLGRLWSYNHDNNPYNALTDEINFLKSKERGFERKIETLSMKIEQLMRVINEIKQSI